MESIANMLSDRVDLEPLDEDDREKAQRLIDETQPLKHVPIKYVLPFLQRCCCKLPGFIQPNSNHIEDSTSSSGSDSEADDEEDVKVEDKKEDNLLPVPKT